MWRFVVRKNQEKDLSTTANDAVENPEAPSDVESPVQPSTSSATGDQNQEETSQTKVKAKQKRKFNPSWQHAFPWVKLVNQKMFCDICMKNEHADKKSTFVTGSDNFHLKSLRKHSSSKGHVKCVENAKARSAPPGTNPAEKTLQILHEKEFEKMRVLFRISHSLANFYYHDSWIPDFEFGYQL